MDTSLVELNQKIDTLTAQVAYLTEQAQLAERQRQERAELMRDLTPIANEAFQLTVQQLEEVQEYIDLGDLLRLAKRLARNGRHLETMLDQIEGMVDLLETVGPITNEAFSKAVDLLAEMERKGYFAFARSGMRVLDNVITHLNEEEMQKPLPTSFLALLRQMNDPAVRRSLALTLRVLQIAGKSE